MICVSDFRFLYVILLLNFSVNVFLLHNNCNQFDFVYEVEGYGLVARTSLDVAISGDVGAIKPKIPVGLERPEYIVTIA